MRYEKERGQGVVELALILPILLYLAVAGADFARGVNQYIQTVNAANAGALYASLSTAKSTDCTDITSVAKANLSGVAGSSVTCGTPVSDGQSDGFKDVTVTASGTLHVFTPLFGIFPSAITISNASTMRVNANGS